MTKQHVLIVATEDTNRKLLKGRLEREGFEVTTGSNASEAEAHLKTFGKTPVGVIVSDVQLSGAVDGFSLLEWVKTRDAHVKVILMNSAEAEKEVVIRSVRWGASDYLEKPVDLDALVHSVKRCMNEYQNEIFETERTSVFESRAERAEGKSKSKTWFVSKSQGMNQVNEWISVLRRESMKGEGEESLVLLIGEKGAGKKGVARMIHAGSRRGRGPWITLNCSGLNESELENELFGYEKGAFTGAIATKRGAFELAHGGTLFLEGIETIDPRTQSRILRVLHEKTCKRMAGVTDIPCDVRVIASSQMNLEEQVEKGAFREDLYRKMSRVAIQVPALRDRTHDIIPMALHFAEGCFAENGKKFPGFSAESQAVMQGYRWPGNIRELFNVVERVALVSPRTADKIDVSTFIGVQPASRITVVPLPKTGTEPHLVAVPSEAKTNSLSLVKSSPVLDLQDPIESYTKLKKRWSFSFEREYLVAILNRHDGNVSAAAREANIDRSNFLRLLRRHRMTAQEFRKDRSSPETAQDQQKEAA